MTTLSIYHLHLLDDAGFLMPLKIKKQPSISVTFRGLSWSGHEFLDSVRRKDVWDHTNAILKKGGRRHLRDREGSCCRLYF
ncbi:DUF2513 domain-containing protein [Agrobacterium tumefaciens]|uniref:DUF2513 domain-containing protein n=1 Tax=Agrobacterium tumefaciens TaxID=358 RepID=UPI0018862476